MLTDDPAFFFQAMKQSNQGRLFNAGTFSNLRLGERFGRPGKVDQGPPLRLAQSHRLEPLIELQPPGPGRSAEERPERFGIEFFHETRKIVSRLTILP